MPSSLLFRYLDAAVCSAFGVERVRVKSKMLVGNVVAFDIAYQMALGGWFVKLELPEDISLSTL